LLAEDGIVGVDIDECVDEAGDLSLLARDVLELLDSYSELSPSGRGVRIFTTADLGEFTGRRKGSIELYNAGRYLTVTGHHLRETPADLAPRLDELRVLYWRYLLPEPQETPAHVLPPIASDEEVLGRMFAGKLGDLYEQIYHGDVSGVYGRAEDGQPDESRADTLLCNGLAFYTAGDAEQMRRILLSSPRAAQRVEKWAKRVRGAQTYLEYQIEDSIRYSRKR
jgi:primase-polymerase (primpol)-like protein